MSLTTFHRAVLLAVTGMLAIAGLWWKCRFDPTINFLPKDSRAEWIVFHTPADGGSHRIAMLDTVFRREFEISNLSQSAELQVRAARRLELTINDKPVEIATQKSWKTVTSVHIASLLQTGSNKIEARVFNDDAPPALWLEISNGDVQVRSDRQWEASIAGSAWRPVSLASDPWHPMPGNLLAGGEKIFTVLPRIWPLWLIFAIAAVVAVWLGNRWLGQTEIVVFLAVAVLVWVVLFWNNTRLLPFHCGYDATDHVAYIKYIQERKALPLPTEGFEMFQPPLYYALSAAALSMAQMTVADSGSVAFLRSLTMIFGIAHFVIALLCLRLLFPARPRSQLIGLLLAAFLPMQLYLSHYATNETLAAMLVSLAIYLALRIFTREAASLWDFCGVGLAIGAALLTKATALLLIPPLFGALILKMMRNKITWQTATLRLATTLITLLVVSGWYYLWIWKHFGTPIVGNWERRFGFTWWQDPGFRTAAQYFRFGNALFDPLFSGFNSFADGIFSTMWGDGLGGGLSDMLSRTPWNYDLMIGGYWLALVPTGLILIGAAVAIGRFARRPSAEWFLLIGFPAAVLTGIVFLTMRVASYAQVKAFYGLSTLVPLCALAAVGWEKFRQAPRSVRLTVASLLVLWALNSFFAFWIRDSVPQHIYAGRRLIREHRLDAAAGEVVQAVAQEPSNAVAQCLLAAILDDTGKNKEANEHTARGLQDDATDGYCMIQNAVNTARSGNLADAAAIAQRVVDSEPENKRAYDVWFACAREAGQTEKAMAIGRDGLAVLPFIPDLHYRFGLAAAEEGDFTQAVPQFAYALLLQPGRTEIENKMRVAIGFATKTPNASDQLLEIASAAPAWPPLLNDLAWIFATNPDVAVRNGGAALRLSEEALALSQRTNPNFLITFAAACGEAGHFTEGISAAEQAATLAKISGESSTLALAEKVLGSLKNEQPYREELAP